MPVKALNDDIFNFALSAFCKSVWPLSTPVMLPQVPPALAPLVITYPAYGNTQPLVLELAINTDLLICVLPVGSIEVNKPAVISLKKYVAFTLKLVKPVI